MQASNSQAYIVLLRKAFAVLNKATVELTEEQQLYAATKIMRAIILQERDLIPAWHKTLTQALIDKGAIIDGDTITFNSGNEYHYDLVPTNEDKTLYKQYNHAQFHTGDRAKLSNHTTVNIYGKSLTLTVSQDEWKRLLTKAPHSTSLAIDAFSSVAVKLLQHMDIAAQTRNLLTQYKAYAVPHAVYAFLIHYFTPTVMQRKVCENLTYELTQHLKLEHDERKQESEKLFQQVAELARQPVEAQRELFERLATHTDKVIKKHIIEAKPPKRLTLNQLESMLPLWAT